MLLLQNVHPIVFNFLYSSSVIAVIKLKIQLKELSLLISARVRQIQK